MSLALRAVLLQAEYDRREDIQETAEGGALQDQAEKAIEALESFAVLNIADVALKARTLCAVNEGFEHYADTLKRALVELDRLAGNPVT